MLFSLYFLKILSLYKIKNIFKIKLTIFYKCYNNNKLKKF